MNLRETFISPWWLKNRHMQSCFPVIFRRRAIVPLRWEELSLPDGDFLDLAWVGSSDAPLVILLHGLEGSVRSHYIQRTLQVLLQANWQAVVMHFRSCSGRINRQPYCYNAGDTQDLAFLLEVLAQRFPQQSFQVIGFSLGANVLLHYLSKHNQTSIQSAIAISTPFELAKCANYTSLFYQWNLLKSMKRKVIAKINQGIVMPVSIQQVQKIKTLRDFDELITAPLYGYKNADDYYQQVSCRGVLSTIEVPTLIMHAKDDPFVPETAIPTANELSQHVVLELSEQGGHVGFIHGRYPWSPGCWLSQRILQHLRVPLEIQAVREKQRKM